MKDPFIVQLRVDWQNLTPGLFPTPERRHGNINLSINISSPRVEIEPTTSRFYSHTSCRCATTGLYPLTMHTVSFNCVDLETRTLSSAYFFLLLKAP